MRCAANFEVITSVSVVADNRVLTFNGHEGEFTARIKNIPRDVTPSFPPAGIRAGQLCCA